MSCNDAISIYPCMHVLPLFRLTAWPNLLVFLSMSLIAQMKLRVKMSPSLWGCWAPLQTPLKTCNNGMWVAIHNSHLGINCHYWCGQSLVAFCNLCRFKWMSFQLWVMCSKCLLKSWFPARNRQSHQQGLFAVTIDWQYSCAVVSFIEFLCPIIILKLFLCTFLYDPTTTAYY